MQFKNIHFIINPISGKGRGEQVKKQIQNFFPQENLTIKITQKKKDAYNFALQSINENAELIVSCGGDGTLNEVASALINKEIPLAIVPIGSGNGLARHLNIPMNEEKALLRILNSKKKIEKIDCGKINDIYFFSNAGIGFDATVIEVYSQQTQRQLLGYLKSIILSIFKFRPVQVAVNSESINYKGKTMMFNVSNSNCLGYGLSISPKASLQDGELDVNLIKNCSWILFGWIGIGFLFNKKLSNKRIQFNSKELKIDTDAEFIQIDGECYPISSKELNISILPLSLPVLFN